MMHSNGQSLLRKIPSLNRISSTCYKTKCYGNKIAIKKLDCGGHQCPRLRKPNYRDLGYQAQDHFTNNGQENELQLLDYQCQLYLTTGCS